MGSNWSIPTESVGHPALLIRVNEKTAKCDVGLAVIKNEYLNPGMNKDSKRGLAASAVSSVWWLLATHPYPPNFWEVLPLADRKAILAAGGGTAELQHYSRDSEEAAF